MFCSRDSSLHLQLVLPAQGGARIPAGFVPPAPRGWQNLLEKLRDSLKESGKLRWLLAQASAGLPAPGSSHGCRGHSSGTSSSLPCLPGRTRSRQGGKWGQHGRGHPSSSSLQSSKKPSACLTGRPREPCRSPTRSAGTSYGRSVTTPPTRRS